MTKRRHARRTRRNDGESLSTIRRQRKEIRADIERHRKADARAKIEAKRAAVVAARASKKDRAAAARAQCQADRAATTARLREERAAALLAMKERAAAERAVTRAHCIARRAEVGGTLAEARAALVLERQEQAEMRRLEAGNRKAAAWRAPKTTRAERKSESDDAVRANIEPEELALFERVKSSIKARPGLSRTEAFRKYVEEHPDEVIGAMSSEVDDRAMREAFEARSAPRLPSLPPPASSYPAAWDEVPALVPPSPRVPTVPPVPPVPVMARTAREEEIQRAIEAQAARAVTAQDRRFVESARKRAARSEAASRARRAPIEDALAEDARARGGAAASWAVSPEARRFLAAVRSARGGLVAGTRLASKHGAEERKDALEAMTRLGWIVPERWPRPRGFGHDAEAWIQTKFRGTARLDALMSGALASAPEVPAASRAALDAEIAHESLRAQRKPSAREEYRGKHDRGLVPTNDPARDVWPIWAFRRGSEPIDAIVLNNVPIEQQAIPRFRKMGAQMTAASPDLVTQLFVIPGAHALPEAMAIAKASFEDKIGRENPRGAPPGVVRYVTRGVLGGAYKARGTSRAMLTHSVGVGLDDQEEIVLCRGVDLDSIADPMANPEGEAALPTCPRCLERLPRAVAALGASARERVRNPGKPSAAKRTIDMFTPTQASGTGQKSLFVELSPAEQAKEKKRAIEDYRAKHWGDEGNARISTMRAPDPTAGVLVQMGELVSVVYRTTKEGDPKRTFYEHDFEGPLPILAYNDEGLIICSGGYTIKDGGITG
jgi:hypothetical protein